jgi:hypothetical protein
MTENSYLQKKDHDQKVNLRISMGIDQADVNCQCHTFSGQVPANQKHIMRHPHIVLVLWGHFYVTNPDVLTITEQLVSDLITGSFMNGLAQYGVGHGSVMGSFVIDIPPPESDPTDLTRDDVRKQLVNWINEGTISPAPAIDEENLMYILFLPTGSTFSESDSGAGGYHKFYQYNANSSNDDLFWATILTNATWVNMASSTDFVKSLAFIVSHELNEAFTDRDNQGFTTDDGCEIGDICESRDPVCSSCCITVPYRSWKVEQYWSNWDNNCINADQPVSLRKFLNAIAVDGSGGLRQLQSSIINVDFVASRM